MSVISLHNAPLEILLIILDNVDPISLINLAQTCQTLRATIRPTRINFLQRLLALELIPEYGGIAPLLRGRDSQISPPMGSKDWKSNKYACGGCLKLLPHTRFDNHNILRLDLRKPPPGSREANRLAEWWFIDRWDDSVRARIFQHRIHIRARDESLADVRKRYHEAIHPWDSMRQAGGINQFLWAGNMEAEILAANDRIASDHELLICGLRRHSRRCIECIFLRGDWHRNKNSINNAGRAGSLPYPVITGRKLDFYNLFDRCFPNLFHPVPRAEMGRRFYYYGAHDNKTYHLTMRILRCGGCAKWNEALQFRFLPFDAYEEVHFLTRAIDKYLVQDAELGELREPRCNRCFLKEHGMAAFRRHLVAFARSLMVDALKKAQYQVLFGWDKLRDDFRLPFGDYANYWVEYGKSIVSEFPIQGEDLVTEPFLTTHQLDELSQRFTCFTSFVERMYQGLRPVRPAISDIRTNEEIMASTMDSWFRVWYDDYHLYEKTYRRLQDQLKWIEQHELEVVSYALEADPWGPESWDLGWEVEEES
ncbi:hypothetical protein QR685DRAFT_282817 [Neurospora intermedia]|uniref:F-box domain-containing protein n=1 Tax=Neurospora intermedia TaxID=5142 RepID=A0ABR3D9D1_NEUIN